MRFPLRRRAESHFRSWSDRSYSRQDDARFGLALPNLHWRCSDARRLLAVRSGSARSWPVLGVGQCDVCKSVIFNAVATIAAGAGRPPEKNVLVNGVIQSLLTAAQSVTLEYCKMYIKLMAFWHEKFPGRVYDLNYEALTERQKDETRKLLEHVGLNWEDQCLEFHQAKRANH